MISTKKIATNLTTLFAILVLALTGLTGSAGATVPPSIEGGDIYYGRNLTKNTTLGDPISAEPCDVIQYKVRIHNPGPTETLNNVTVQAVFGTEVTAKNVSIVTVRATNAQPTNTSDTATVNISSLQKLTYISGSSELLDANSNFIKNISDVTAGSGASIGNVGVSINEKRFVQFKANIDCPVKPKSLGVCELLELTVVNKNERKVQATVTGQVENATIVGYSIDFGDGTTVNEQTANHTYAEDGTYNVVGSVQVKFANGETEWKTASACESQITFQPDVPPETPQKPKSLPKTGPTAVFATFLGVSSISALLHRLFTRR